MNGNGTYDQAFSEYGQEVVDTRSVQLGFDCAYPHCFLVYHLHYLPLLAILRWAPIFGPSEVVLGIAVVFPR